MPDVWQIYGCLRPTALRRSKEIALWHSIRINDQWRICFKWKDGNAFDVEITDYH